MTATNHMLFGAVVAMGIQRPLLVAPLAVLSHFVLDVLPHFGIHKGDHAKRDHHPLFQYIVLTDIFLTIAFLVALPIMFDTVVSPWLLLLGMLSAFLPDVIWVYRFYYEARYKKKHVSTRFAKLHRFHSRIQWGERPWGIIVELVWFGGMGVWLAVLAT